MTALFLAALALTPALQDLHVTSGSAPFAGDRRLLTTVSPNGDGFRDAAVVHLRLTRPARVRIDAVATNMVRAGKGGTSSVWHETRLLGAGAQTLTWRPARSTQPRTYILRLRVGSRVYGAYGPNGRQNAPVVRVQGVDAAFTRRSYAPGESAELRLATDARLLRLQVFAYQSPGRPSEQDVRTSGLAKTGPIRIDWSAHRNRTGAVTRRPGRRLAKRPVLRPRDCRGRPSWVRTVHRAAAPAGDAARGSGARHQHVGRVQLRRRGRRRLGRLLVRERSLPQRRPGAAVPRLRRAVPLPRLGSRVHRVAEPNRTRRGLPVGRRPGRGRERRRARAAVRPRRLPRSRGVRDAARVRRDRALSQPRGQPHVPRCEQPYRRVDRVGETLVRRPPGARSAGRSRASSACSTSARITASGRPVTP